MKSTPGNSEYHPACQATMKFCIQELEKYKGNLKSIKQTFYVMIKSVLQTSFRSNKNLKVDYTKNRCVRTLLTFNRSSKSCNGTETFFQFYEKLNLFKIDECDCPFW